MKTEARIADPKCGLKGRACEFRHHYINYYTSKSIYILISIYIAKQQLPDRVASQKERYASGVTNEVGDRQGNCITGRCSGCYVKRRAARAGAGRGVQGVGRTNCADRMNAGVRSLIGGIKWHER
jgi:hypothetical protein